MKPTLVTADQEDINSLRDWLKKQPHLPPVTDVQLGMFLHSCKQSLERTKNTVDTYYTVRSNAPEFFSQRDPNRNELQKTWKTVDIIELEKDAKGLKLLFGRLVDSDISHFSFNDIVKVAFMTVDVLLLEDPTPEGFVVIIDLAKVSLGHLSKISLASLKKAFVYIQEGFPLRLIAVHIINSSSILDTLMLMIKPFLSKELAELLHFHSGGAEILDQHIDKCLMPKDYDGDADSCQKLHQALKKKVESQKEWFKEDEKLCVDEALRPSHSKNSNALFGIEGSFKKLNID